MHFEKVSKQLQNFFQKLVSKKAKALIDIKPATTLDNLFTGFLFILKPSVLHQKFSPMRKNQFNHYKMRQISMKKTVQKHLSLFIVTSYGFA